MSVSSSAFDQAKVLVTGGMGFVGSNLARRLADLGARVAIADAMLPNCGGNGANISGYESRLDVRNFDLRQTAGLGDLVRGQDFIFNCAGRVSHLDSMVDPVGDMEANLLTQIHLLEACRKEAPRARVVFASTRQIYGKPKSLPVDETHPLRPVDINGVHKVAAEALHTLYFDVYGLRTVSLRMTNTYGPRMRVKDARQTFLGVWLRSVVRDEPIEVWGGQQVRDLAYVDDVVDAFLAAAIEPAACGSAFNIGGSPPISLMELANLLVKIGGGGRVRRMEFPAERKVIDIGDYFADDQKFRDLTGWAPKVSLPEGLARSIDYYRRHIDAYV